MARKVEIVEDFVGVEGTTWLVTPIEDGKKGVTAGPFDTEAIAKSEANKSRSRLGWAKSNAPDEIQRRPADVRQGRGI